MKRVFVHVGLISLLIFACESKEIAAASDSDARVKKLVSDVKKLEELMKDFEDVIQMGDMKQIKTLSYKISTYLKFSQGIQELGSKIGSLEKDILKKDEEIKGFKEELSQKEQEASDVQSKVSSLQSDLQDCQSRKDDLESRSVGRQSEMRSLQIKLEASLSQVRGLQSELNSCHSELSNTQTASTSSSQSDASESSSVGYTN
ncbi:MAG: hypothetical protein HYS08_04685 [Chlamydiae bacterium]|nr:hypothetical protein [Chlamydiota bacterium]MBI3265816.1 hypothetical protein [Chlamydiota bacterium]